MNLLRHSPRLIFPLVVLGAPPFFSNATSARDTDTSCALATAHRIPSMSPPRSAAVTSIPSRTSATSARASQTLPSSMFLSTANAATEPGRRSRDRTLHPIPAFIFPSVSRTVHSTSSGAMFLPPITMRSLHLPTTNSSPRFMNARSPVRRYRVCAADRSNSLGSRGNSVDRTARVAPKGESSSTAARVSFQYPLATDRELTHTSPTRPSRSCLRVLASTIKTFTSAHGAPQLATRRASEPSPRTCSAIESDSNRLALTVVYVVPPSHTYTTLSARPYPALIAETSKPKSENASENASAVSALTRSLALRQCRSALRSSISGARLNRSATSLYAKSGACVIVAPYLDMARTQTTGSLTNAAGDRNALVTSAGPDPHVGGGIVSGTRYPPTSPMSWYCGSHDTFTSSTLTSNCRRISAQLCDSWRWPTATPFG